MDSIQELFEIVKKYCREESKMSETAYHVWIEPLTLNSLIGTVAVVAAADDFRKNMVQTLHLSLLQKAFEQVMGFPIEVKLCVASAEPKPAPETPAPEEHFSDPNVDVDVLNVMKKTENVLNMNLENSKYEYTFDTFIEGESNSLACAACRAVANQSPNETHLSYNPLFVYGPSGLGKTHLLHAIKHEYKRKNPSSVVIYTTSEAFINELILSIREKTMEEFRQKYREADLLMIDDIQFIAGKTQMQEEFFHTFNDLYQHNKQIVITSDRLPKEIKTLEDRLKNRFEWGLIADIGYPQFETRVAIIERKAALLDLKLDSQISYLLAEKLKTNIRQLEGAVKKLKAHQVYGGSAPTLVVANNVIHEIMNNESQPIPYTVDRIIEEVAHTYSISPEDIRSKKKSAVIARARQVSIYIVRELTGMSQEAIGNEFGGRDHSTVVYSLKTIEKMIETDPNTKAIVEDIKKNIKGK